MEVLYNPLKKDNLSIALGFFDGIHKGHKKVIETAVLYAKKHGLESAVISFKDHPTCFLSKKKPEYILSLKDKTKKLETLGVDYLYLLDFDEKMANMSKEKYFEFLKTTFNPKMLATGFNHYFGKNKEGDTGFLESISKKNCIKYEKIEAIQLKNNTISSSNIRDAITCANLELAYKMLGYHFFIKGEVIEGQRLGRKLGFKTVNIKYPENIIKLPYGVYCTKIKTSDKTYKAVTNWGIKPTIADGNEPIIETNIIDFDEDLYGKNIKISFYTKIRNEKKFDNLDDLQKQISKDVEFSKNYICL